MPYSSTTSPGCTWSPEVPRHDKLLPGIARTLRPLTDPLAGNPRVLNWSQELQDAFDRAKSALSSAVSLTHPSPSAEVSEVSEVSVPTTPSPFPTSSVINFSELARDQLSCPDILRLKVSPTLRLVSVPVQDGSLLCDAKTKVLRPSRPLQLNI